MVSIHRSSLSNPLILLLIVNFTFSKFNPKANPKFFYGYCTDSFNQCQHVCIPNPTNHRQFHCTCRNGYFIQNDGFSCNKTPPKDLEMNFEVNTGSNEDKVEKFVPNIPVTVKKSTKKLVTREKRSTRGKSKTLKPITGLTKGKCSISSCKNGGRCQMMNSNAHNESVIYCLCRLGFEGVTCDRETKGVKFPKFLNGYLAFPERILSELDFRLSLYVKPAIDSQADTVLAFKQSFKGNNFLLGIEQNQFIFRIETTKFVKKINHHLKVENTINRWYKIEIERKDNNLKLSVDDIESRLMPVEITKSEDDRYSENKSDSNLYFICDFCLYLGGHPDLLKVLSKNQYLFGSIETSFIGCIRNFMIDGADIDMRRMPFYGKAVDGLGIDDCSAGLCESAKCQKGHCKVSNEFLETCQCRFGYTGKLCDEKLNIEMPSFNGDSYANYKGLRGTSRSENEIFIKFKPTSGTGILMYQGYSSDKRGDFIALYLLNGYPWVAYDLGSGTILLKSNISLTLDEWHTIKFHRVGRKGTLIIDYGSTVIGFSPGLQMQLTIQQNLQLGGVDNFDNVSAFLSIREGFKGCIDMLFVDNTEVNLVGDILMEHSRNLQNCESHPCGKHRKVCWTVGKCMTDQNDFQCSCPLGYIEKFCQTKIEISGIRQPSFNGSSYLVYNDTQLLKKFSKSTFKFSMVFNLKSHQTNRILMHLTKRSDTSSYQFFTLLVNSDSGINVEMNTGVDNFKFSIIDNLPLLSDHKITIQKLENSIRFSINKTEIKSSNLNSMSLSTFGFSKLFIGGTDFNTAIFLNLPMQSGIIGCIKDMELADQKIKVSHAIDGRTVAGCNSRDSINSHSLETRSD